MEVDTSGFTSGEADDPKGFASSDKLVKLVDRKSTRLNSSHMSESRMPSSA